MNLWRFCFPKDGDSTRRWSRGFFFLSSSLFNVKYVDYLLTFGGKWAVGMVLGGGGWGEGFAIYLLVLVFGKPFVQSVHIIPA